MTNRTRAVAAVSVGETDEGEIMRRVAAGDPAALDELLRVHWHPVLSYAQHILDNRDTAEDITQEAFVRLWKQSPAWQPQGRVVRAFLIRVTRNLALNERRRQRVRTRWRERSAHEPRSDAASPVQALEARETHEAAQEAIRSLPERRREVFVLARYHQMSYREIADMMGISIQTVANQMGAALSTLRERLDVHLGEPSAKGGG